MGLQEVGIMLHLRIRIFLTCLILLISNMANLSPSYSSTIEYQADYLGVITQINLPAKNLKIYLLDTRQLICEPFGSFIQLNNLVVKPYALAVLRISTGKVLKMAFFDDLQTLKQKVKKYALTHNVNLTWRKHTAGQSVREWWMKYSLQ